MVHLAARREIMEMLSPSGPVYQAGTLSGNPLAMCAGFAALSYIKEHPEIYVQLEKASMYLENGFKENLKVCWKKLCNESCWLYDVYVLYRKTC